MATITPSVSPGSYLNPQTVSFSFSADITQVAVTTNAAAPSISKYIAYDTLVPPNPFIGITEDGRGRVVYDGGFPKFYNSARAINPVKFSDLTSAQKYLHNAIKWVANPAKVASGNNKILILGDTITNSDHDESYSVESSDPNGFVNTFQDTCNIAGFPYIVTKKADAFPNNLINYTLADYEQYALVLLVSSNWTSTPHFTTQSINDLVTYRENGNGIIIITDHGYVLNSIADVNTNNPAFFKTANQLASKFGAYFTGDYNRTPVNVGFIRANYGNHPLYAGMADTDDIPAGASESKLVVQTTALYAPNAVPAQTVSTSGLNTINILATLSDGSVITARYVYNIQGTEFVFTTTFNPITGMSEQNNGKIYADLAGSMLLQVDIDGSTLGTVWGEILCNGKRIGEQYYSNGKSLTYWYAGNPAYTPVLNGDVIQQAIAVPFTYTLSSIVSKPEFDPAVKHVSMASKMNNYRAVLGTLPVRLAMTKVFDSVKALVAPSMRSQYKALPLNVTYLDYLSHGAIPVTDTLTAKIYPTTAACVAAVAATTAVPGVVLIDAQTSKVYAYKSGVIQEIVGLKPQDFFGTPRLVVSSVDGKTYRLNESGTVTNYG